MMRLIYAISIFVCICLSGCRTAHQEPAVVDHVKIDTVHVYSHSTDSIYLHDSIYTIVKGDTVTTDRWHTLYKYQYRTDTLYQSKVDSVPVPYEVIREVKYTPKYMKLLAAVGALCFIAFLFIILVKVNNKFRS